MMMQDWQGFQLYKAYLYNADDSKDDVTFMAAAFESDDIPTGGILEFRYTFRGAKYRLRFHKGDLVKFPPYEPADVPRVPRCTVLMAMQGAKNVTQKVKKYAGPNGDFHYGITRRILTAEDITKHASPIRVMDTAFKQALLH